MSQDLPALASNLAATLDYQGTDLVETLKATAFNTSTGISDAQMSALILVAQAHKLNPFTKEIYAFPQNNGIVPVVSVDGWLKIINQHPQMDGLEFEHAPDGSWCTAIIWRKDRSRPTKATEFLAETARQTETWRKYPQRMLRHKAVIQAARMAFGFAGFYDPDEAEKIKEGDQEGFQERTRKVRDISELTGEVLEHGGDS